MSLAVRFRAWLRRSSLDRRLAQGEDPSTSRELAWRAEQLLSPKTRHRLAARIEELVEEAEEEPSQAIAASPPLPREAIRKAHPLLLALARELGTPERLGAQGVALAELLLVDEGSALYAPSEPDALERAIEEARAGLRPAGAGP